MFQTFFKTMAHMANKMEEDDLDDLERGMGETGEATTRGNRKLFIYTFVEGIEVRALCDGEKRGTQEEEPGTYYATASEMVSLVREKAEGLATGNSTNRDRFKTEILLANVTSVAKMTVGRIMREWTRQHPPKRMVHRVRLRGEEARRELRKQRRKRRRTIFKLSENLPFAHMGPLSPREQAIVEHFQMMKAGGDQPNRLQRNEGGEATDSNVDEEDDDDDDDDDSSSEEEDVDEEGDDVERREQEEEEEEKDEEKEEEDEEKEEDPDNRERRNEEDNADGGRRRAGEEEEREEEKREERQEEKQEEENQRQPPRPRPREQPRRPLKRRVQEPDEPVYREEVAMVPVEMTFDALAKEFVECFKHLEELSVKFHDDRLRQFPAFAYQHNPLARLFSIRANLTDLEAAHIAMLGSTTAGVQHTRNFFPASMVLSLYLKGFPDRFRDMVNSAVTVDPARYMHGWDDVLDRIEEMLGIWGKTSDVVYMGLLSQIKKGGARGGAKHAGTESKNHGRKKQRQDWDRFINSLKEESPGGREDAEEYADDAPVTKAELKSIIAAALTNPNSQLQQAKDQDRGYHKRDDWGRDNKGRRHQRDSGHGGRKHDNGRRTQGGGATFFEERMKIAAYWQNKMCKEGVPRDLKLCINCHEWHFLHVSYGCPKEKTRGWDPKAQPFNDFPATKEAQSILRVQDEEDLRSFKQKHEGKTPREYYRSLGKRDQRHQHRRKDF